MNKSQENQDRRRALEDLSTEVHLKEQERVKKTSVFEEDPNAEVVTERDFIQYSKKDVENERAINEIEAGKSRLDGELTEKLNEGSTRRLNHVKKLSKKEMIVQNRVFDDEIGLKQILVNFPKSSDSAFSRSYIKKKKYPVKFYKKSKLTDKALKDMMFHYKKWFANCLPQFNFNHGIEFMEEMSNTRFYKELYSAKIDNDRKIEEVVREEDQEGIEDGKSLEKNMEEISKEIE